MADPFITTDDLSNQLGRDVTADAGAEFAVEAVCDLIRDLSGQAFTAGTSTVALDGTGTDVLLIPQQPVTAVGTVTVDGGTIADYTLNPRNGALFRGSAGRSFYDGWRPCWPRGRQNVQVTYEHGYETIDVPKSVRLAALAIASRVVVQGVAMSEVVGDVQITYAVSESDLTQGELRIIKSKWRPQSF